MFSPCYCEYNMQFGSGVLVPEDTIKQISQFTYNASMMPPSFFLITAYRTGMGNLDMYVNFVDLSNNNVIARIPSSGNISLATVPTNYSTTDVLYIPSSTTIGIEVTTVRQGAAKSNANILNTYMR